MVDSAFKAMNRTHEQIRLHGAIGSFDEGIEIAVHGLRTRLIAWPGNGFQTESVHVLTLAPDDASPTYRYQMSEESLLCLKGAGEVFLRGQWVSVQAGDLASHDAARDASVRVAVHVALLGASRSPVASDGPSRTTVCLASQTGTPRRLSR